MSGEPQHLLTSLGIPDASYPIFACRDQAVPIRTPIGAPDLAPGGSELQLRIAGLRIPDMRGSLLVCSSYQGTVGVERACLTPLEAGSSSTALPSAVFQTRAV